MNSKWGERRNNQTKQQKKRNKKVSIELNQRLVLFLSFFKKGRFYCASPSSNSPSLLPTIVSIKFVRKARIFKNQEGPVFIIKVCP